MGSARARAQHRHHVWDCCGLRGIGLVAVPAIVVLGFAYVCIAKSIRAHLIFGLVLGAVSGYVEDFIDIGAAGLRLWTFNVSDLLLVFGLLIALLGVIRSDRPGGRASISGVVDAT